MYNQKPPFEITDEILSDVVEIGELVGRIGSVSDLSASPRLRRENRIKTIYSSLAIEQNKEGKLEKVRVGLYWSYRRPGE